MAFMGIDGGGSTLRVAITDTALHPLAEAVRSTVNPSVIGHAAAAALIQDAMHEVLSQVTDPVEAVGIGVAGASVAHSADWLTGLVRSVIPGALIVPSSDALIALVGAHGGLHGAMVVAGTGSVALAITPQGEPVQAGGWGYLLGDEGSGFWLGIEALRACVRWQDGIAPEAAALAHRMMEALGLVRGTELLAWVYRQPTPTREIAQLAGEVLDAARVGDVCATRIVEQGAQALAAITNAAIEHAGLQAPAIQFGGGLLNAENPLTAALCRALNLPSRPTPRHSPVIGAALLAKLRLEG